MGWAFASVAVVALALLHWWQLQQTVTVPRGLMLAGQFTHAIAFALVVLFWLPQQLAVSSLISWLAGAWVTATLYSGFTRNWVLAVVTQSFGVVALVLFGVNAGNDAALAWMNALAPVVAVGGLAWAGHGWATKRMADLPAAQRVGQVARIYAWVGLAALVWWTFHYVPLGERVWAFTGLGIVAFLLADRRQSVDWLIAVGVLNACALGMLAFALADKQGVSLPNALAVLIWMAEQQWARRRPANIVLPERGHQLVMGAAGLMLWWLSSAWVKQGFSGFYLTASWSAYAFGLLALGFVLRERTYRWLGLGVLGAALARVILFDVWRLETIYRILSFFALGLVLLVLGFLYNKFQDRIRQWL
jgi:hypothetical protein